MVLHKPKGIWVEGSRLWVTDIDVVWVFNLKTRQGRKAGLPGAKFANDPTVKDGILFVSDTGTGQIYRVEPADFLDIKGNPTVNVFLGGQAIAPNGLYPAADGSLLVVGYDFSGKDRGIYTVDKIGKLKDLSGDLGRLDGVAQLKDGSLLVTDWKSGSLFRWDSKTGMRILVSGFTGPADFCVVPQEQGLLVVVPDLVKSKLRLIRLSR
jgi:sugar lactone lactonase YvrE